LCSLRARAARPSAGDQWFLDFDLSGGFADAVYSYGDVGDVPIAGDWNSDGVDEVGVVRDGFWYLNTTMSEQGGIADISFQFGNPGDRPLVYFDASISVASGTRPSFKQSNLRYPGCIDPRSGARHPAGTASRPGKVRRVGPGALFRWLVATVLGLLLASCAADDTTSTATTSGVLDEARVGQLLADYLKASDTTIMSVEYEGDHLGVYVRPNAEWSLDEYINRLPSALAAVQSLLDRVPTLGDADLCADATWTRHAAGTKFITATQVKITRDELGEIPAGVDTARHVFGLAHTGVVELKIHRRIQLVSAAYAAASGAS